jgi:hypothetical protein
VPNILREPLSASSKATSRLRSLRFHLCTATVQQRLQSAGILSRGCQRGNVIIPVKKQSIFPGSALFSPESPGASDLFWYRWVISPVDEAEREAFGEVRFLPRDRPCIS